MVPVVFLAFCRTSPVPQAFHDVDIGQVLALFGRVSWFDCEAFEVGGIADRYKTDGCLFSGVPLTETLSPCRNMQFLYRAAYLVVGCRRAEGVRLDFAKIAMNGLNCLRTYTLIDAGSSGIFIHLIRDYVAFLMQLNMIPAESIKQFRGSLTVSNNAVCFPSTNLSLIFDIFVRMVRTGKCTD